MNVQMTPLHDDARSSFFVSHSQAEYNPPRLQLRIKYPTQIIDSQKLRFHNSQQTAVTDSNFACDRAGTIDAEIRVNKTILAGEFDRISYIFVDCGMGKNCSVTSRLSKATFANNCATSYTNSYREQICEIHLTTDQPARSMKEQNRHFAKG